MGNTLLRRHRRRDEQHYFESAIMRGDVGTVKRLLQSRHVSFTSGDHWATRMAAFYGHVLILEELLKRGVDPTVGLNYAARKAAENGHLDCVELLARDDRVDFSAADQWAIRFAARNGHANVVQFLLNLRRVNPCVHGNLPLLYASQRGHKDVFNILMADRRVEDSVGEGFPSKIDVDAHQFIKIGGSDLEHLEIPDSDVQLKTPPNPYFSMTSAIRRKLIQK